MTPRDPRSCFDNAQTEPNVTRRQTALAICLQLMRRDAGTDSLARHQRRDSPLQHALLARASNLAQESRLALETAETHYAGGESVSLASGSNSVQ